MTVFSNSMVHFKTKLFMMSGVLAWLCLPICTSTIIVQALYPFNIPVYLDYLQTWLGASATYLYFIGYIRQFPIHRSSWLRMLLIIPEIVIASTVCVILENIAVVTMWFGNWYSFYIVQKEVEGDYDTDVQVDAVNLEAMHNVEPNSERLETQPHLVDHNVNLVKKEELTANKLYDDAVRRESASQLV